MSPNPALLTWPRPVASGSGGSFDPINGVNWQHVYWTEGPQFAALAYSDGSGVSLWPDEIGGADFTQPTPTAQPLYRASSSLVGNRPAVVPDEIDDLMFCASMTISNTSVVWLGSIKDAWDTHQIVSGVTFPALDARAPNGNRVISMSTGISSLSTGTGAYSGTAPRLLTFVFAGASSMMEMNGTVIATGNAGNGAVSGDVVELFGKTGQNRWSPSPAAFLGFYSGDVRSDPGWADFESWVSNHYGITT